MLPSARMSHSLSLLALSLSLAGCGQSTTQSGDAGADTGAIAPDGGTHAGADTGTILPTDAGPPVDAPLPEDTGTSAHASVTITDFFVGGNCKPVVPADPITAAWTAHVSGATGTSATLTSATLTLVTASGASFVQTLTVAPTTIPLSGGAGTAAQSKQSGTPDPTDACGTLCGAQGTLQLVFQIDGAAIPASASGTMGCAL